MNNRGRRKEFIFEVPVKTTHIAEFNYQQVEHDKRLHKPSANLNKSALKVYYQFNPEYIYENIAISIAAHINEQLPYFDSLLDFDKSAFCEFIKNSFDAYAKKGLVIGDKLVIKLVIQEKEDTIFIKIKDNGSGFIDQIKGKKFTKDQIKCENKSEEFLGKNRLGIRLLNPAGEMFFKNRKAEGATVYLTYPSHRKKYEKLFQFIENELTHLALQKSISQSDKKKCEELITIMKTDDLL